MLLETDTLTPYQEMLIQQYRWVNSTQDIQTWEDFKKTPALNLFQLHQTNMQIEKIKSSPTKKKHSSKSGARFRSRKKLAYLEKRSRFLADSYLSARTLLYVGSFTPGQSFSEQELVAVSMFAQCDMEDSLMALVR